MSECLTIDPASRPTAAEALQHKWLASDEPHFVPDPDSPSGRPTNLLPHIQRAFDARKTCAFSFSPGLPSPRPLLHILTHLILMLRAQSARRCSR